MAQAVPGRGQSHREWFQLVLRKSGDTVELWVENKKVITYTDPKPLAGGVPAIWTNDNGIALARARLIYAEPPQPRTDAHVLLDDPWYPEWGNVGQPLTLDFPTAWSTAGRKVSLKVTPRTNPAGDDSALTVEGRRATFLPRHTGSHWYQIAASDGEQESPAFHLLLPVFDPALGRDDRHAQVLYRFDTPGDVIHDSSGKTPALDIPIPADAPVAWQTGLGLTLHGQVKLISAEPATRLEALQAAQAFTFEAWLSTDTVYPPMSWSGNLFSVETGADGTAAKAVNLQFIHRSNTLSTSLRADTGAQRQVVFSGFRTGLQHLVVTWDGKTAVTFINGRPVQSAALPSAGAQWAPNPRVLLGSSAGGQFYYLGTYYLLALHDVCFTPEQVLRHYQAGPSAK